MVNAPSVPADLELSSSSRHRAAILDDMAVPDDVGRVLEKALRSRASSVAELAGLLDADEETTAAALGRLEAIGFVSVTNGVITYRRPDAAIGDRLQKLMARAGQELEETLHSAETILGTIPALLQAWEMGETEGHRIHVDVLHGPYAAADIWRLQYSRGVPRTSDVMMPDTAALFTAGPEHQSSFWASRLGEDLAVRLIMSTADATNPAAQDRIQAELDAGVQIRMHPAPPSWMWITDHETAGFPLEWGQTWPTSVMAARSEPIAIMLTWIFERVWEQAIPVREHEQTWGPILRLMSRGMTMEAATRVLGLAPRTGRRRVADAMKHFGADTHFALGAAWSKAQGARTS